MLLLAVVAVFSAESYAYKPAGFTYVSKDYKGHQVSYDAIFNDNGLLYVANAYGVLEFDGYNWNTIKLNNSKCPFSLAKAHDGRIYVGGDNEIGYIEKDSKGISVYHSLTHLIPNNNGKIGDWIATVVEYKNKIYFEDMYAIYVYDGKKISVIKPGQNGKFLFLNDVAGDLMVMEENKGIGKIKEDNSIQFLAGELSHLEIKGAEKTGENAYTFYSVNGIYFYNNATIRKHEGSNYFENALIKNVSYTANSKIIGTEKNGCYILDNNFQIIQHLDQSNSVLQSNYAYGIDVNKQGDILIATDNGITIFNYSNSSYGIQENSNISGSGYSSLIVNNGMYLGTSQGLYFNPAWKQSNSQYSKINGVKAFVYALFEFDGSIFCGDHADVYQLSGTEAKVISKTSWKGAWFFHEITGRKDIFLVGTFEGIDVYRKVNGNWQFSNTIDGYQHPARMFEFDTQGNLWVNSETNGLYCLTLDENFKKVEKKIEFCAKLKLKADFFKDIIKDGNTLKISSSQGIFSVENGNVEKDDAFSSLPLKFERIRKIKDGLLYTIVDGEPVVLRKYKNQYVIDSTNIINNTTLEMVGLAEMIKEYELNKFIVGTAQGFSLCDNLKPRKFYGNTQITALKSLENDSVLDINNKEIILSYNNNSIVFNFSASAMEKFYPSTWYVKLSTKDEEGEWRKNDGGNFKEYTNLPEGEYTFQVKSIYRYKVLGETTIHFTVLPPWYRTTLAKVIYFLLVLAFAYFIYFLWKVRVQKITTRLLEEKKKEMLLQESTFKAEQLKMQLQEKEMDLSYVALNFAQRKELLQTIGVKLKALMHRDDISSNLMKELKSMEYSLNNTEEEQEKWDNFQVHFNTEYNDFITKLQELDPKIKESMLLMCTYLRMGKNNKEIASLLNISLSALDKRKLRLKEKFNVPEEITLNEFLRGL